MTNMTSKGQVTVPKKIRDALGLKAGSEVEFEYRGGSEAVVRGVGKRRRSRFAKLRGSLGRKHTTSEVMALLRGD